MRSTFRAYSTKQLGFQTNESFFYFEPLKLIPKDAHLDTTFMCSPQTRLIFFLPTLKEPDVSRLVFIRSIHVIGKALPVTRRQGRVAYLQLMFTETPHVLRLKEEKFPPDHGYSIKVCSAGIWLEHKHRQGRTFQLWNNTRRTPSQ